MDDSRNVDPDAPLTETAAAQMIASAVRQQREREAADIANSLAASIIQQSNTNNTVMLKPADVGYFDPSATDLSGRGVVSDGEVNKYSDIFPFCDRLTHLAVTHGEDVVRSVWSQCLLGPALVWHSHILTDEDRELLRTAPLNAICNKLKSRFRIDYSTAFDTLKNSRFTLQDIAAGRDIMAFIQVIMRNAKACHIPIGGQLIAVFEALDADIQYQLRRPSETTAVDEFFRHVQERESILKRWRSTAESAILPA
ncbi:hypothetical protein P885DRAFT_62879 [Corynascus similis CBS 632.67]